MNRQKIARELLKIAKTIVSVDIINKYGDLVPSHGKADTVQGEILRAFMKIQYRNRNDGDFPTIGYGAETSGPALAFLIYDGSVPSNIKNQAKKLEMPDDELQYRTPMYRKREILFDKELKKLEKVIEKYLKESTEKNDFERSRKDMFDYSSKAMRLWGESEYDDDNEYDDYDDYYD